MHDLGDTIDPRDEVAHLTLRYPGFPSKDTNALRLLSVRPPDEKPDGQAEVSIESSPASLMNNKMLAYECEIALGREANDVDIEQHRRMLVGNLYTYGIDGDVYNYDTWEDHLQASMIGRGNTDNVVDPETAEFCDEGFRILSDAELNAEARLLERRCVAEDSSLAHYKITLPKMCTYANIEKYGSPTDDGVVAGARKRKEAPQTSMTGAQRKMAVRAKRAAGPVPRPPLRHGVNRDSRSEDDD